MKKPKRHIIGKPSIEAKRHYLSLMADDDFRNNYKGKELRDYIKKYYDVKFEVSFKQ